MDEALRNGSLRADELVVLWKSSPIPYDPFVHRVQLCQPVVDRIKHAFFMENKALQSLLRVIDRKGFIRVNDDHYREIREMFAARP
jgi:phosphonate transport system substrate-binding protein